MTSTRTPPRFRQLAFSTVHEYRGTEARVTTYRGRCACGWRSPWTKRGKRHAIAAVIAHIRTA